MYVVYVCIMHYMICCKCLKLAGVVVLRATPRQVSCLRRAHDSLKLVNHQLSRCDLSSVIAIGEHNLKF